MDSGSVQLSYREGEGLQDNTQKLAFNIIMARQKTHNLTEDKNIFPVTALNTTVNRPSLFQIFWKQGFELNRFRYVI